MNYEFEKLAVGIYLYKNTIPADLDIPSMLESSLDGSTTFRKWNRARVGDAEELIQHRKCVDFKIGKLDCWPINSKNKDLAAIWNPVNSILHECKDHYEPIHKLRCEWQQVINFVRYGEGEFFNTHPDHGPTFTCTLSSVLYLNDDYEGGELWFEEFDLTVKPKRGDHFLFPSNYIYRHRAMPVSGGIKYSAVTMFDYTDRYHEKNIRRKDY
jgi:hypothetical protein